MDEFSLVSFADERQIVKAGETAAAAHIPALQKIGLRQKKAIREKIELKPVKSFYIKDVGIEGNKNYTRAYVMGKLKLRTPAEISYREFNEGVNNLSATGNFDGIDYKFVEDPDNSDEFSLHFKLIESESKMLLRLGVHYDDLYRTAALVNVTRKRMFTNNDVTSLDLIVGDNLRYNFEYYIDKGFYWSVGLTSAFNSFNKNVAIDFILGDEMLFGDTMVNEIDLKYDDLTNRVFVQTVFRRSFLLRLGAEHKWLRTLSETIGVDEDNLPRTVFENTSYFSSYGVLKYDTFDNKHFPNKGVYFEGDFHWYLFANGRNKEFDPFSIAKAQLAYAFSFTSNFSVVISAEGGFKIGDRGTNSLDFFVGGYGFKPLNNIVPFYGYEALSLRGDTYIKSELILDCEIIRKNHIIISGNIANIGDQLIETGEWIDGIDYSGFAVGYGLETFLGPIELKYAFSPERNTDEWHVTVGFRF